jgi:hypothetical protein
LKFLGGEGLSIVLLLVALSLWVVAPLLIAQRLLRRQDI